MTPINNIKIKKMEDNNQDFVKKQAKKAAWIVGIATFLGFSILMFLPTIYGHSLTSLFILTYLGTVPLGIAEAYLFSLIVYFIFKHLIKNKLTYRISLVILIIIGYPLGIFGQCYTVRMLSKEKPYTNQIDTNRDGKVDKWVYSDNLNDRAEIDTDYDGMVDIKEYYYNGNLIKKEYFKEGKLIKTENFPIIRNRPQ